MATATEGAVRLAANEAFAGNSASVAVAFRATGWTGKETVALNDGRNARVVQSDSVLQVREELVKATRENRLIILTPLEDGALGQDVLYRLAGCRVRSLGLWDPLMSAFGAKSIDPRVQKSRALAEALLSNAPAAGYPKAPNGVLTKDHAWEQLARWILGELPASSSELVDLASHADVGARIETVGAELRDGLIAHLGDQLGPAAGPLIHAAGVGNSTILVPLGLVTSIAYSGSDGQLMAARGLLGSYWDGMPDQVSGVAASRAAEISFERADGTTRANWQGQAQELLGTAQLGDEAWRSNYLVTGFEQRLSRVANHLLDESADAEVNEIRAALELLRRHQQAQVDAQRLRAVEMAVRLHLWLATSEGESVSLDDAAQLHVDDGGWADLAREHLRDSEANERLAAAYAELRRRADGRRTARSLTFAARLKEAVDADTLGHCVGVEEAIVSRVAPAASDSRLLLVVLDGLSEAAFRSIQPGLESAGWTEIGPGGARRLPMVAMVPSITRISRASLLSGSRNTGGQKVEREGLESALADFGEPKLFHKGDLDWTSLESEIAGDRRVVVVVVNTIDDLLDKGDQINVEWSLDSIEPLRGLVNSAASAGRVMVIAGDHGHVLERGSDHRANSTGGSRWRAPADSVSEDEVVLSGPRVLEANGTVIAAATESVRYTKKAAGYHGGATPQEMITPLAVFSPPGTEVDGWSPCAGAEPSWWMLEVEGTTELESPAPATKAKPAPPNQTSIFEPEPVDESDTEQHLPTWVDALLASEGFAVQRKSVLRAPNDEQIGILLATLDKGTATEATLARALEMSTQRVTQVVASVRPLLNLEGFQVLTHDRSTGEIRLDRDLLRKQFSI